MAGRPGAATVAAFDDPDAFLGDFERSLALEVLLARLRVGVLSADLRGALLPADPDMTEAGREALPAAAPAVVGEREPDGTAAGVVVVVKAGFSLGAADLGTTPAIATASYAVI